MKRSHNCYCVEKENKMDIPTNSNAIRKESVKNILYHQLLLLEKEANNCSGFELASVSSQMVEIAKLLLKSPN